MADNPDNPLASFFSPKDQCGTKDQHKCGLFAMFGSEEGLNLMTESTCMGATIFHDATDEMIKKAHQNNGYVPDVQYAQELISLGDSDPGLESVLKAQEGGLVGAWEDRLSLGPCVQMGQDPKFIDGLYGAIKDGSLVTKRQILDKNHAQAEFLAKCTLDAATTSLCKLGIASQAKDLKPASIPAENIKPTPKPTPSTPPPFIPGFGPTPKPGSPTPKPTQPGPNNHGCCIADGVSKKWTSGCSSLPKEGCNHPCCSIKGKKGKCLTEEECSHI